jgi:hypothetical protein
MLNPLNARHRERLPRAFEHSFQELRKYSQVRDSTIRAYLGISRHTPEWDWYGGGANKKYEKSLPKGNLLQTAALSMQIALAYGEPEVLCTARNPDHYGMAFKLDPALNRMGKLLNLGDTARMIAADSFFGYGIYKVGVGRLPLSARAATGLSIGPCIWRVSQDDYIYDITAGHRDQCVFESDVYTMPVEDAIEQWPEHADRLQAMTDTDRLDSQHVLSRPSQMNAPELKVYLVDVYFPGSQCVCTWPIRHQSFGELANEPIGWQEYNGHWSGVYEVLNHLYSPDELVPVAQAESSKALHFLFNDLMEATANQARTAKVNPIYQAGADKDMKRIWDAADRYPVSVIDPSRFSTFEIPGPSQSQTSYMAAVMQLFKQMTPTMDEPQRAPTATQGTQVRETTNAIVGEARRKAHRSLQLVNYKLGDLLISDSNLVLPATKPVMPGSKVMVDATWNPPHKEPRVGKIDDFEISIEPYPTQPRSPEERLALIFTLIERITAVMQARAMGSPINVEKLLGIMARYSGVPEINELFEELAPAEMAQRQQSQQTAPRVGVGQYVRENVSTKTDEGALTQNLNEAGTEGGGVRTE